MFIVIYRKLDGVIFNSRVDSSVEKQSPLNWLSFFADDNNVDANDYAVAEIDKPPFSVEHGKYIYSVATNEIQLNPNYDEPPSVSTSGIPTTDSSTGVTVNV